MRKMFALVLIVAAFCPKTITAQNNPAPKSEMRVNIDCNAWCDFRYIKTEINYVDFVPDRFLANIFIQITSQETGSGGDQIKLFFTGQENFKGKDDTLQFIRSSVATEDEYRIELVRFLKLGLTSYIAKTSLASKMNITADVKKGEEPLNAISNKKDPWNFWVFNVGTNGSLNKDDYSKSSRYSLRFEANKITDKLKLFSGINYSKNKREISLPGYNKTFRNENYGGYFNVVKSLTDHWSYGGYSSYTHSTFSNYDKQLSLQPSIEYSVYPYKDAVKKSITFFYQIGPTWNSYIDTTYYNQVKDKIIKHSLSANANFIQKWGSLNAWTSWNSFLNSFTLLGKKISGKDINNVSIGGYIEIRIVKGLSVNFNAYADFTKGVYPNIRKDDFTSDDLLANVRQYPTSNSLGTSIGINYRFGSIYNNVVNPRFNRNGGGRFFFN